MYVYTVVVMTATRSTGMYICTFTTNTYMYMYHSICMYMYSVTESKDKIVVSFNKIDEVYSTTSTIRATLGYSTSCMCTYRQ